MALNPAPMQQSLYRLLKEEKPRSGAVAAQRMAQIYADYAAGATAGSYGLVALTGSEKPRLEGLLRGALSMPVGAAPIVASAWATGLALFWAGSVFTGGGAGTTLVGVPIVIAGLTALYSNVMNTEQVCAAGMSSILDAATRTLLVVGPLGPQPVV